MDSISNLKKKLVIITSFIFVLICTTQAICVPRNLDSLDNLTQSPTVPVDHILSTSNASPATQSSSMGANAPSTETSLGITSTISDVPRETPQKSTPSSSTGFYPELINICNKTDYASLCISSISPLHNGKSTDAVSVLETAITAATLQAKLAISAAAKLASLASVSRTTATTLQDCSDNYSDAIDNLQVAMNAIKSHDIGTANSMLSSVVTDSWTCDDEFTGKNPMAVYEEKLGNMASNCLAIASLIK